MQIQICCRNTQSGVIEIRTVNYEGDVPPQIWRRLARRLMKLDEAGYFYPQDALDAYHAAVIAVERTAAQIARGELVLTRATPATYLTSTLRNALNHFHERQVRPLRDAYRRVEGTLRGEEECEITARSNSVPEGSDVGAAAFAEAAEGGTDASPQPMTAQQLAEALPALPSARMRRDAAAAALEEIFAGLPPEPVRAFRAYLACGGNFLCAARAAHIGVNRFYRTWPVWLAAARALAHHVSR